MAPKPDRYTASSDCESSLDSEFFNNIDTLDSKDDDDDSEFFNNIDNLDSKDDDDDSEFLNDIDILDSDDDESQTVGINAFAVDDENYSVQTPSVYESVATRQTDYDLSSVNTPSIVSTQENYQELEDDKSDFGSVVNGFIHSIIGSRKGPAQNLLDIVDEDEDEEDEDEDVDVATEVMEEEYDEFMNEFSNQSIDIMRKRSVGLVGVMSALEEDYMDSDIDNDDDNDKIEAFSNTSESDKYSTNISTDDITAFGSTVHSVPSVTTTNTKTTRRSNRNSRSGLIATGLKGFRRRSKSPSVKSRRIFSPKDSIDDSTLGGDSSSIAFSFDSSIKSSKVPMKYSRNQVASREVGNATKIDLEQRRDLEQLLAVKKYQEMLDLIHKNPKLIAIQTNQPSGKTFLHVIAAMSKPPPETIILKVVSVDTSLVTVTDNHNNTPLHFAAQHVRKGNMHAFTVLLKFHPMGACEQNSDGDLPLHIVTSNYAKGAEEAAHLLLETNPKAISEPNNKGKIPLHLALSEGSRNLKLLLKIVKMHKFRRCDVEVLDAKGNTPLHSAILNKTKYDAIDLFNKELKDSQLSAYMKANEQGYIPLHFALSTAKVDPLIIISLIKAAPFTAGMATPSGDMPVALATKTSMKPEIVKLLLASDLPIELGNKNGKAGMGAIIEREHGHSWWHVAVECQSRFVDVIISLLSDHATFVQIVAMVRCVGPDGKTPAIDAITASLEGGLKNLLRFYHRYEISMSRMPVCSNEIQSFAAVDHGEDLEKMKVTGPWLNKGFTTIKEDDRKMKADNSACEIAYVPWDKKAKEVTLRCYAFDDSFDAEKKYREKHNISSQYFEAMIKVHKVTNYSNASFTSGKLLCISYEKSDLTLRELMNDEVLRANRNWLVKCHLLLKDVATSLQHLHNESLIHGELNAHSIAQFQSKWKLMYIGQSTKMGNAMGGGIRRCIPPESLSGTKSKSNFKRSTGKRNTNARGNQATNKFISKSGSKLSSKSRMTSSKLGKSASGAVSSMNKKGPGLPPLPTKQKSTRKKFGVFVFGMHDMGLGNYGRGRSKSRGLGKQTRGGSIASGVSSVDSSFASGNDMSETDEGSLRIIAMQEDEISRLRKALEEKEHVYRHQLIQERADFKRQEVERQRELQQSRANMLKRATANLFLFAPEKVMASPTWDVWSFGLLMAELIVGESAVLPSFAGSDEEFVERLMTFGDTEVAAIREEVRENAGDLAADLVARLLHPNPLQRIDSMSKVLQHIYFHEEIVESTQIFKNKKKSMSSKMKRRSGAEDSSVAGSYVGRGRIASTNKSIANTRRSVSRRRKGLKR